MRPGWKKQQWNWRYLKHRLVCFVVSPATICVEWILSGISSIFHARATKSGTQCLLACVSISTACNSFCAENRLGARKTHSHRHAATERERTIRSVGQVTRPECICIIITVQYRFEYAARIVAYRQAAVVGALNQIQYFHNKCPLLRATMWLQNGNIHRVSTLRRQKYTSLRQQKHARAIR